LGLLKRILTALTGSSSRGEPRREERPEPLFRFKPESPDDVGYGALWAVLDWIDYDWPDVDARLMALPPHWRVVYTACTLEGEVNNGGHHQYFWNSNGAFAAVLVEDLKRVGATPYVDLAARAVGIHGQHDAAGEKAA